MTRTTDLCIALIRTHHITSRKKLQKVKKAAAHYSLPLVLVRSGGSPGIMYAEGSDEVRVSGWVNAIQGLRYKDFQCAQKPTISPVAIPPGMKDTGSVFEEVTSVADFGERMEQRGLSAWWKTGMGYESSN
ncbi:hypothetical protein F5Y15DRAFT_350471 [Xylariaceae sp. FL0016]|nr:hypothetical protein F5Y15DRAFT_350471 [Xylariaceae sp. FL0016]